MQIMFYQVSNGDPKVMMTLHPKEYHFGGMWRNIYARSAPILYPSACLSIYYILARFLNLNA